MNKWTILALTSACLVLAATPQIMIATKDYLSFTKDVYGSIMLETKLSLPSHLQ